MDPLLETLAVLAPIVIVSVIAIYASLLAWEAADDGPVLLGEMLGRQGDDTLRLATASGAYDFARAVRSCATCHATAQCRAWLDSGAREGYEAFCPNAGYVGRIAALTAKP
jgi:hypothetical protein